MKASEFHQHFAEAFNSCYIPSDLQRMKGKACKWQIQLPVGKLRFAFATNAKASGLLPMWPGEFRLQVFWSREEGDAIKEDYVSFFQYTIKAENNAFRRLQVEAIKDFSETYPDKEHFKQFLELIEPDKEPVPNVEIWYYYTNAEDARKWGLYFGEIIKEWIQRFEQHPESNEDWCWRVLWPHLQRNS